jgi:hypothetical protein
MITIHTKTTDVPTVLPAPELERGHVAVLVDDNDAILAESVLREAARERDRVGLLEIAEAIASVLDAKGVTY